MVKVTFVYICWTPVASIAVCSLFHYLALGPLGIRPRQASSGLVRPRQASSYTSAAFGEPIIAGAIGSVAAGDRLPAAAVEQLRRIRID